MYGDALTTKERIKDRLQIESIAFDDVFDNLILAVTKRISQMCGGRRFTQATFTNELHDGSDLYGAKRIHLITKNAPLGTITSVQYKTGLNSDPTWTSFSENDYDVDSNLGVLYFPNGLPRGKQNIRITYAGGFSGYSIGVQNYWTIGEDLTDQVDGAELTFTLPEDATEIVVYADGLRELASNYTFVSGANTFTFDAGRAPVSALVVDYKAEIGSSDSEQWLPADLVEVAEVVVIRIFKRRESEGRSSEGFQESQITWTAGVYTAEDLATIKNYRRGYSI